ncbi:Probable sufite oxidase [Alloactinosynnema sp. L-07]|uniref:molybdopterin-dependent oxidoreductase n=1 Tax=Alloactinosynnema sp. L-07 TaxID=1653480 RepID=UPI00065EF9A0|nr:molybdopterin-dependent oxidoreductase [Alloactinosynnema sp. L-07]CRK60204.1 Probable sufite oxidase [Alloactinosynnema sp. L-07]
MDNTLSRRTAALIGVLAVASALAAGHLVAGFVGPNASPFLAVGNSAIDLTPHPLKDFAIRTFGVYDKLVLLGGMAATLVAVAVVAGLLSRRKPWPGQALAVGLGLLAVVAVFNRPDLGQLALLAPVVSLIAGVGVFTWLHGLASAPRDPADELSRRSFLITSAGVAVGAGVFGGFGQFLSGRVDVEGSRAAVGKLTPSSPAPAVPATADFAGAGTPKFITSNRDFYRIDTALTVPRVRAEDWRLRLHGMVDTELTFDYGDIRNRPLVEKTITMTCVSNEVGGPYISTATFIGVPMRDLLDEAGIRPGADQLFSTSIDGWTCATPLADLRDPKRGALLAIGMNGEPLPVEHGFPARVVVPGLYGYVSATKWVTDMEVIRKGEKTFYWEDRGWASEAPIKVQSRIDAPAGFATVPAGKVTIAGIAWAQNVGIDKVEVRVDGGEWRTATLATEVNDQTWRMWKVEMDLPSGGHRAEVRATNRRGETQTDKRVPPIPDGATGWHSTQFTVA